MKVVWTEQAWGRLLEIERFIARDDARAATRLVDKLIDRGDSLKEHPRRGRRLLDLPESGLRELIVDNEIEGMLREYAESLASQGVDLENAGIEWPALAEQVRPQAERRVHARLLLDAAADQLEVSVAEDEFENALAAIAKAQRQTTVAVRQALDRSGRLSGLRASLRRDKTLRQLMGDVEPDAEHKEED